MARVRVILLTFRRPQLLPRALESLRAQSFRDWICEVHNGDPADPFPGELLAGVRDPRFQLVQPPHRTGPVEAFNLAHRPVAEEFQSILEDDNWWDPEFLSRMVDHLDRHPQVELAWSNMRIWHEQSDGSWVDSKRTIWALPAPQPAVVFRWPHLIQFNDFLYSNGAMLLRSRSAASLIMPDFVPHDMIEHTRERMMTFPIMLVTSPLANFAVTRGTFRSTAHAAWGRTQALLGAAFLRHVPISKAAAELLWENRRQSVPPSTSPLFFAALLAGRWSFIRHARAADWWVFVRGFLRHPLAALAILRAKSDHADAWRFLASLTQQRTDEARERGFTQLDVDTVVEKQRWQ